MSGSRLDRLEEEIRSVSQRLTKLETFMEREGLEGAVVRIAKERLEEITGIYVDERIARVEKELGL